MKKKGLSTIISGLLIVLLTIVAVGIVWGVVNKIIKDKTDTSCFGNYDKLTLNNDYTCYEFNTNTGKYNVQFSVSVKDIELDGIVVSLVGESGEKSFTIEKIAKAIAGLKNYDGTNSITIPEKNAGLTYIATGIDEQPGSITIAPIIKGEQCPVADSITQIDSCAFIV